MRFLIATEENQAHLAHHGIKGQKWGIRRYQNEDGSLTAKGRKRYGFDENGQRVKGPKSRLFYDVYTTAANETLDDWKGKYKLGKRIAMTNSGIYGKEIVDRMVKEYKKLGLTLNDLDNDRIMKDGMDAALASVGVIGFDNFDRKYFRTLMNKK